MVTIPELFNARRVPELWVLRHGETEWNVAGRMQGWLDSPLTERGVMQARIQGEILANARLPEHCAAYASPSGRAVITAEHAITPLGLTVLQNADLREVGMGAWQGKTLKDVQRMAPELDLTSDPHLWKFSGPGCESLQDMVTRVAAFLTRLQGPAVIVTHGLTSRVLRCLVLEKDPHALSHLPGGQGVVHHVKDGKARVLTREALGQ